MVSLLSPMANPAEGIAAFLVKIQALAVDDSLQYLQTVVDENYKLRDDYEKLEIAYNQNFDTISQLRERGSELETLRDENLRAERLLNEAKRQLDEAERTVAELLKQQEHSHTHNEKEDDETEELLAETRAKLAEAEKTIADLQIQQGDSEAKGTQLQEKDSELEALRDGKASAERQLAEAKEQLGEAEKTIAELLKEQENREKATAELENSDCAEVEKLKIEKDNAEKSLVEARAELEEARRTTAELTKDRECKEKRITELLEVETEAAKLRGEKDDAEKRLSETATQLTEAQKTIEDLRSQASKLEETEKTVADLQKKVEQLEETEKAAAELGKKLEEAEKALAEMRKAHETQEEAREKKIAELTKQVDNERLTGEITLKASEKKAREKLRSTKRKLEENLELSKRKFDSDLEAARKKHAEELDAASREAQTARQQLIASERKLRDLEELSSPMEELSPDAISESLESMFASAYNLVQTHFNVDLDDNVLSSMYRWERLQNHSLVKDVIPLPLSNTATAKQLRVAAVMVVIASALVRHSFQPTHLLENMGEMSQLLSTLARTDPGREENLRSVLLAVLPERQEDMRRRESRAAVREIMGCAGPLLSGDGEAGFRAALEDIVARAGDEWHRLQQHPEKIEPKFGISYGDTEAGYWDCLPCQEDPSAAGKAQQLGDNGTPEAGDGDHDSGHANGGGHADMMAASQTLSRRDMVCVIWPSFLSLPDGEPELLKKGFVLGDELVHAAQAEERNRGPHRMARQHTRTRTRSLSIAAGGGSGNGGPGGGGGGDGRRDFLLATAGTWPRAGSVQPSGG